MSWELEDFLKEGVPFIDACMALEAISSCGIEGIEIKTKEEFEDLCKRLIERGLGE